MDPELENKNCDEAKIFFCLQNLELLFILN